MKYYSNRGRRAARAAMLLAALAFPGAWLAHADFYISNGDAVELFSDTGMLVNANFISYQGASGLAIGPDGNLYVATASPADATGAEIDSFNALTGAPVGAPFVNHVTDNLLNNPGGIAFGPDGNLYVGDLQNKLLVYNSAGADIQELTSVDLSAPSSLAFAPSGVLYYADENTGNVGSYTNGTFSVVNQPGVISVPHDVAVGHDGNLYVLDISGSTGGIYRLNPTSGSLSEIVNYATSSFFADDLIVGPDGNLYVSGQDESTGENEVLGYSTTGAGGTVFADLGMGGTGPTYMTFSLSPVPEPSTMALISLVGAAALWRTRRNRK